ncbi:MAG: hypothetical protein SPL13_00475 [Clostridia bacterium]|nr:hypothetical protein [Clostridia bacterium]
MSDRWKHVSVGDCVKILIFSLVILALALFVPYVYGGGEPFAFTFQKLPLIGDGSAKDAFATEVGYISNILPSLNESQLNLFQTIFTVAFYGFFVILLADILFSFILMIFRSRVLRIIFSALGKIFAVLLIVIALCSILFVAVNVYASIKGEIEFNYMVFTSGATPMLAIFILSIITCVKQFKFFNKPYDLK